MRCHGPSAKTDYPEGVAIFHMHDNEIRAELQISFASEMSVNYHITTAAGLLGQLYQSKQSIHPR